jgi:hypothetical protein
MVHEKVIEAYKAANVDYIETADDMAEQNFYRLTTWTGVAGSRTSQPIKKTVGAVYRTKIGNKEYMYYSEKMEAYDRLGNPQSHTKIHGKYEKPDFRMEVDPRTNISSGKEVTGHRTVYYIEYSRNLLESILEASDNNYISTQEEGVMVNAEVERREFFYIVLAGGQSYGPYSRGDYLDGTYDELLSIGKTGKTLKEIRSGSVSDSKDGKSSIESTEKSVRDVIPESTIEYKVTTKAKSDEKENSTYDNVITSSDKP